MVRIKGNYWLNYGGGDEDTETDPKVNKFSSDMNIARRLKVDQLKAMFKEFGVENECKNQEECIELFDKLTQDFKNKGKKSDDKTDSKDINDIYNTLEETLNILTKLFEKSDYSDSDSDYDLSDSGSDSGYGSDDSDDLYLNPVKYLSENRKELLRLNDGD